MLPSQQMESIGIRQDGDPILRVPCEQMNLPHDRQEAESIIAKLTHVLWQARELHEFAKGTGLAAPQIGISRAVTVLTFNAGAQPFALINPEIVSDAPEQDEQFEGCLSFFDVRGKVRRSLRIEVRHSDLDGDVRLSTFEQGAARLVAHEIDHLNGILYKDRMRADQPLISSAEYSGSGSPWRYSSRWRQARELPGRER
jgi:peptide deformylase